MLNQDWEDMTPEAQREWIAHLRRMAKPDEMIEAIARYWRTDGTPEHAEASSEMAHTIRGDSFSIFGRWVAWRHKGVVYRVVERPDGEYVELETEVVPRDLIVGGKTDDGMDVVELPDDPTYAMN